MDGFPLCERRLNRVPREQLLQMQCTVIMHTTGSLVKLVKCYCEARYNSYIIIVARDLECEARLVEGRLLRVPREQLLQNASSFTMDPIHSFTMDPIHSLSIYYGSYSSNWFRRSRDVPACGGTFSSRPAPDLLSR